jgi:hypothetical protein
MSGCIDLRSVALRSPSGEITVLLVNRCLRDLTIDVVLPAKPASRFREFVYSRDTIPTSDRAMLKPRALPPGGPITVTVPQDAFLLLTEMPD